MGGDIGLNKTRERHFGIDGKNPAIDAVQESSFLILLEFETNEPMKTKGECVCMMMMIEEKMRLLHVDHLILLIKIQTNSVW